MPMFLTAIYKTIYSASIFLLGIDSRPKCSFNVGSDSEGMPLLNCVNKLRELKSKEDKWF